MTQTIIVALVLAATLFFAVRWAVRTIKGRGSCHCGGCHGCPLADKGQCDCSKATCSR